MDYKVRRLVLGKSHRIYEGSGNMPAGSVVYGIQFTDGKWWSYLYEHRKTANLVRYNIQAAHNRNSYISLMRSISDLPVSQKPPEDVQLLDDAKTLWNERHKEGEEDGDE